jgi:hypothetical protein
MMRLCAGLIFLIAGFGIFQGFGCHGQNPTNLQGVALLFPLRAQNSRNQLEVRRNCQVEQFSSPFGVKSRDEI